MSRATIITAIATTLDTISDSTQIVAGGYIANRLNYRISHPAADPDPGGIEQQFPNHLTDPVQSAQYMSGVQIALGAAISEVFEDNAWRTSFMGAIADGILSAGGTFGTMSPNQILYTDGAGIIISGSALTFNGTVMTLTGSLALSGPVSIASLSPSAAVFTDASKNLVSVGVTGIGSVAMSTAPVFTSPTIGTSLTLSYATASTAAAFDASKNLISVANTGSGNNVLSASPTLTGTLTAAAANFSGAVSTGALTVSSLNVSGISTLAGHVNIGGATDAANITINSASGHIVTANSFGFQSYGVGNPSAANVEVLYLTHTGTSAVINVTKAGTGTYRDLLFQTAGATQLTLSGSTGAATLASDLVFSSTSGIVRSNTADGSDNKAIFMTGGGAYDSATGTRGGCVFISGNEYSGAPGNVLLSAGNTASSRLQLQMSNNTQAGFILFNRSGVVYAQADTDASVFGIMVDAGFGSTMVSASALPSTSGQDCPDTVATPLYLKARHWNGTSWDKMWLNAVPNKVIP